MRFTRGADREPAAVLMAEFYGRQDVFEPCAPYATSALDESLYANSRFDCAHVQVPPAAFLVGILAARHRVLDEPGKHLTAAAPHRRARPRARLGLGSIQDSVALLTPHRP